MLDLMYMCMHTCTHCLCCFSLFDSNTKKPRKDKALKSFNKGAKEDQFIYQYSFKAK